MKEQGPRREPHSDVNKRVNDKYNAFMAPRQRDDARLYRAIDDFKETQPSEETTTAAFELVDTTAVNIAKRTDNAWISAMSSVPGMTNAMMLAIWDEKDRVTAERTGNSESTDTTADTQHPQKTQKDPLEAMFKPGTPFEELNARHEEALRSMAAARHSYFDAQDALNSTIPTEETAEAADTAAQAMRQLAENATDTMWVQSMHNHPLIGTDVISEVWNSKEQLRTEYDNEQLAWHPKNEE